MRGRYREPAGRLPLRPRRGGGGDCHLSSAPHFVAFSDAVNHGDAAGIASSIGDMAMDYYTAADRRRSCASTERSGERFADLIVHLFTGDTGALGDDVRALGTAYLDTHPPGTRTSPPSASRMVQYAEIRSTAR